MTAQYVDEGRQFRTLEDIGRDIARIPTRVRALEIEIELKRHAVQVAFSRWTDETDLVQERETLIDQGLQKAEEDAVATVGRMVKGLMDDIGAMKRAAPTSNLRPSEKSELAQELPIVTEMATSMDGDAILREIEGALLRKSRVELAAWSIMADRIEARRGIHRGQRNAIAGAIMKARSELADYSTVQAIRVAEAKIAELEEFARSIRDRANEHDEIPNGSPLYQYKFGRRPIDDGATVGNYYARPEPTENWFRRRAGLHVYVGDRG